MTQLNRRDIEAFTTLCNLGEVLHTYLKYYPEAFTILNWPNLHLLKIFATFMRHHFLIFPAFYMLISTIYF